MDELLRRKLAKEASEKEFEELIQFLRSAKQMPHYDKPPRSSWKAEEKTWHKIESLEAFAIDSCKNDDQKKTAGMVIDYLLNLWLLDILSQKKPLAIG